MEEFVQKEEFHHHLSFHKRKQKSKATEEDVVDVVDVVLYELSTRVTDRRVSLPKSR